MQGCPVCGLFLCVGECHYCGTTIYSRACAEVIGDLNLVRTVEHKIPKSVLASMRALNSVDNRLDACVRCNGLKADTPYEVFCYYIETEGKSGLSNALKYRKFVYDLSLRGMYVLRAVSKTEKT